MLHWLQWDVISGVSVCERMRAPERDHEKEDFVSAEMRDFRSVLDFRSWD